MQYIMENITYVNELRQATCVENAVVDMLKGKSTELLVYFYLKKFHNKELGYAFPNIKHNKKDGEKPKTDDLVTLLGMSQDTIRKALRELETLGLIKIEKVSQGSGSRVKNRYHVYQPRLIEDKYLQYLEEIKEETKKETSDFDGREVPFK